jgi:hypothetical protein
MTAAGVAGVQDMASFVAMITLGPVLLSLLAVLKVGWIAQFLSRPGAITALRRGQSSRTRRAAKMREILRAHPACRYDLAAGWGEAGGPRAASARQRPWIASATRTSTSIMPSGRRSLRQGAAVQTCNQSALGWTVVLRRRPVRIVEGRVQGGYTDAFEIICSDCGDHPDLDYRDASLELQRIRGPYPIAAGITAYQEHVKRHHGQQPARRPGRPVHDVGSGSACVGGRARGRDD